MSLHLRRAIVTGASAGIGRAISEHLAGQGCDLVLVARTAPRLEELSAQLQSAHGITAEVLPADLNDADGIARVEDRLRAAPDVNVLVNNAGFGTYGELADADPRREAQQVGLNVTALTRLSVVAAATFRTRGAGGILNISSLAGFQPLPEHATYAATKAYVTSFTQALHEELKPHGVHVSANCPGYTRTEFHDTNDIDIEAIPSAAWMTADVVARVAVQGLQHNRAVTIPGGANRALAVLTRTLPDPITRRLAKYGTARVNAN